MGKVNNAPAIPDDDDGTETAHDLLTDEERASLDEDIEEVKTTKAAQDESDKAIKDEIEGTGEEETVPKEEVKPETPPAPAPAPAETAPAPKPEARQQVFAPPAVTEFGPEAAARLEAIAKDRDDLIDEFDSGSIAADDMKAKSKALDAEERALVTKKVEHETTKAAQADYEAKSIEYETQQWRRDRSEWMGSHQEINGLLAETATEDQKKAAVVFDGIVRKLAGSELADDMSNVQLLDEALAMAQRRHPALFKAPEPAAPEPKPKAEPAKAKRPELPPTLAKIPASAMSDADGSRFGAMNRLAESDPMAFEAALGRMTDEQRATYLAESEV